MARTHLKNISTEGKWLIGIGLVSLITYFVVIPGQHPDALADSTISRSEAVDIATEFLARHGYAIDELSTSAAIVRRRSLIEAVQDSSGRSYLVNELEAQDLESVPFYIWHVDFHRKGDLGQWDTEFQVSVSLGGSVIEFENNESILLDRIDSEALGSLDDDSFVTDSSAVPDTADVRSYSFNTDAFPSRLDAAPRGETEGDMISVDRELLQPEEVGRIASFHLERYRLQGWTFMPDSTWLISGSSGTRAAVRFSASAPIHGLMLQPIVTVTQRGSLFELGVRSGLSTGESGPSTIQLVAGISMGVVVLLIVGFLIITFFRRLISRLIDVKAALADALIFSTVLVVHFILPADLIFGHSDLPVWARWLLPFIIGGFAGGGLAVLIFLLSSSVDSLARSNWSKHLLSMSLVRQGRLLNARVGLSLVRGVFLGMVLLGVTALLMMLLPNATIGLDSDMVGGSSISAVLSVMGLYGFISYAVTGILMLTIVAVIRKSTRNDMLLVAGCGILFALIQIAFPTLHPYGFEWFASGVTGVIIGFAFLRFDLLTCLTALFSGGLIWSLQEGWLGSGSPVQIDFILGFLVVLGILGFGFAGLVRGAPIERVRDYVPEYIRELRQQERLHHELSIAKQVHESFLPARMPDFAGIDIAAECLAAEEVGGDYYDLIPLGKTRLAVAIGDVSGKGIQAAFFMTLIKGFLRTLAKENHEPAVVLQRINELFYENAPRGTFVSMIYGILDVDRQTFTFARAGHNPILRKNGVDSTVEFIQPDGLGIGLVNGVSFDRSIEQFDLPLQTSDTLILFTDGFSEAMNTSRELFGDSRLSTLVAESSAQSSEDLLSEILKGVASFVQSADRHDDMTMVVLRLSEPIASHTPVQDRVS